MGGHACGDSGLGRSLVVQETNATNPAKSRYPGITNRMDAVSRLSHATPRWFALVATVSFALSAPAVAQTRDDDARFQAAQQRFDDELNIFRQAFDRYQAARARGYRDQGYYAGPRNAPPPAYAQPYADDRDEGNYDPARYYRDGANYQERTLGSNDRVYRGDDGRYYCKRSDGTTGLIIGAAGGGILGNVIDGGHSRIVGTLIGGAAGALAGKAIDQNNSQIRCR